MLGVYLDFFIRLYTVLENPYNHRYKIYRKGVERMAEEMGMTDKQFCSFVRLLLNGIQEVLDGMEEGKEKNKLQKIADNLQKTLEDS